MEEKELKKIIRKKLNELKIPANLSGYKYLIDALYYSIKYEEDKNSTRLFVGEVYNYVAFKRETTYSKVERAIRTAVSKTNKKNLTNSTFIAHMTYEILDEIS